jgi:hypothetical protein
VLPGKTLGGVYLASYGRGSVLEYDELIVAAALTRHAGRSGFWISHIYVDDADSVAGGRAIWGLPKDLAQFTWEQGEHRQVLVRHEDRLLCILRYGHERALWRQRLMMPTFSIRGPDLLFSKGAMNARLGIARGRLEVPVESPFAPLGLGRAWMTYHYIEMAFVAGVPQIMG